MAVELFGRYRLEELIGRGGMGEVYRAFDTDRKRVVALKRLPDGLAENPAYQARFRMESELAARLRSAHVIPIHDYGEIDGRLFIDMRLVDGASLADRLADRGAMSAADAVHVIEHIAGALDAAHAAGLVHRDVKPSNVLLSPGDGGDGRDFAYLVDFGIARAVDAINGLTRTGTLLGTVHYMAPERFSGRPVDKRADVYSLACMLCEALTGNRPFHSDNSAQAMYCHLNVPPPRPSQLIPGIPEAFDVVIARGMAKDTQDRYPTAGALAAAARAALTARDPPATKSSQSTQADPPAPDADFNQTTIVPDTSQVDPTRLPGTPDPATGVIPFLSRFLPRHGIRRRWWATGVVAALLIGTVVAAGTLLIRGPGSPQPVGAAAKVRVAENLRINASEVAIDPTGTLFYVSVLDSAATGLKYNVEFRTVSDNTLSGTVPLPDHTVAGLTLAPDGKRLFVATRTSPMPCIPPAPRVLPAPSRVFPPAPRVHLAPPQVTSAPSRVHLAPPQVTPAPSRVLAPEPDRGSSPPRDCGTGTLTVIDTATKAVITSVPLPDQTLRLAVSPDGRRVYVTSGFNLYVIDPAAGRVVNSVPLGGWIRAGVAVTPDGRRVVAAAESAGIKIIDADHNTVVTTVDLHNYPDGVAITPDGRSALIAMPGADAVAIVDLDSATVTRTITVGDDPQDVTVTPDGAQALVNNFNAGTLSVISLTNGTVSTLPVGPHPRAVAISQDGTFGFVITSSNVVRLERVSS